jgi:Uma2 family endonuclease
MIVEAKYPITNLERLELGPDTLRYPAPWKEYLDLLEDCEYQIEYDNHEIILMSIASDPHEVIIANLILRLGLALDDEPDMATRGSNRHVFIPEFQKDYAPDLHVVKGEPQIHLLRKGLTANLNPWLVVEVLSPSTYVRDMNEKLPAYKKISSLRHIVYVYQDRPLVTIYSRIGDTSVWENTDFDRLEDKFEVIEKPILLKDVYKKVIFPEPKNGKRK